MHIPSFSARRSPRGQNQGFQLELCKFNRGSSLVSVGMGEEQAQSSTQPDIREDIPLWGFSNSPRLVERILGQYTAATQYYCSDSASENLTETR